MKHAIKAFVLSGLLGPAALAANEITVEVTVTGSSPVTTFRNAGADITISLGGVSANTLVRIFDNTVSGGAT